MRFLVTAIGSMSADAVIKSLRRNFTNCQIIGTDIHPKDWLYLSKEVDVFYQVPKAFSDNYLASINKVIRENCIDFIIPLTDPEVDTLSEKRRQIEGNSILTLPDDTVVKKCRNKEVFSKILEANNHFNVIKTLKKNDLNDGISFPIVAKPKKGRSSEGLRYIYSKEELCVIDTNYILQPFISGEIITVDFVKDNYNNIACLSRRELIRSSNGAGLSVEIYQDKRIESLIYTIANSLGITGCMNIEFIKNDDMYYLMDINPRFSAGVGFSLLAGVDFVYNHIRTYEGMKIKFNEISNKQIATKHYSDYLI